MRYGILAGGREQVLSISNIDFFYFHLMIKDGSTKRSGKKGCALGWMSCVLYYLRRKIPMEAGSERWRRQLWLL
jgi:hypothetical protein